MEGDHGQAPEGLRVGLQQQAAAVRRAADDEEMSARQRHAQQERVAPRR
jgi:hypothetical protein